MKITKIDVLKLETATPMRPIGCRVYTDAGVYGDGELTMSYGRAAEGGFGQLADMARMVIGLDPLGNEVIWSRMHRDSLWGLNGGATIFSALSAIDIALWDIKGKHFGVPVHTLLGGQRRDKVRAYASQVHDGWGVEARTKGLRRRCKAPNDFADAARTAVDEGFDAVKLDFVIDGDEVDRLTVPSTAWLNTVEERIAAVREAIGPDVDLILENHAHTNAIAGVAVGQRAAEHNVFYYEEACSPDPKSLKFVADSLPMPIASGERLYGRWQFKPFFENASLQIIQPDVGNCGGLTEAKKICDMAHCYDVAVQLHNCHTQISNAATLHLEAVLPNFVIHEHSGHNLWRPKSFEHYCTASYVPKRGWIDVPQEPGLGVEWTPETLATAEVVSVENN